LSQRYDVAIVGGGPAGATAGMCLARSGWRVAIFEAGSFDREKAGETLPPETNPLLRELGLWELFRAQAPVECPGVVSAWTGPVDEVDYAFNPFGSGWHIDRLRFDKMLFEAARRGGAQVYSGQRVSFVRDGGDWRAVSTGGPPVIARFLIDATGRGVAQADGNRERIVDDVLVATVVRLSFLKTEKRDLRTLIEATPSGWWYSACLPANRMIAMFFTGRETFRRGDDFLREQLDSAPLTNRRVQRDAAASTSVSVVSASSSCRRQIAGDGWLCTGDSASSFDPLSGRGIFKAIRQSVAAAKAADATLRGDLTAAGGYAAMVRAEFDVYLSQKTRFYGSQVAWADRPFWKARAYPMK
jgi:flavin-dependent dehydrogenase